MSGDGAKQGHTNDQLVWFVRYGSEMKYDRFVDALSAPTDAADGHVLAGEVVPVDSRRCRIPFPLHFAGTFTQYGGAARAFVDLGDDPKDAQLLEKDQTLWAYGRAYLISWKEFCLFYPRDQPGATCKYSYEGLSNETGPCRLNEPAPAFGSIALVGFSGTRRRTLERHDRVQDQRRVPVLVVTSSRECRGEQGKPSYSYLQLLVDGIRETWPTLTDRDVMEYLTRAMPRGDRDELDWEHVAAIVRQSAERRTSVAIVGGGIAGLYCARELSKRHGYDVAIFESAPRLGGRIETVDMRGFHAEYGPMRFEKEQEPLFDRLVEELKLSYEHFAPMGSDESAAATASDRYNLRHDELRHTFDTTATHVLGADEAKPTAVGPLDLLRLGVVRMFRQSFCDFLDKKYGQKDGRARAAREIDLCVDTTAELPSGAWASGATDATHAADAVDSGGAAAAAGETAQSAARSADAATDDTNGQITYELPEWIAGRMQGVDSDDDPPPWWATAAETDDGWNPGHYRDGASELEHGVNYLGSFCSGDWVVRGSAGSLTGDECMRMRILVQEWLDDLKEGDYEALRRTAQHRVWANPDVAHLLHDEGFWNAMNEELSPAALRYIRDEGTFYHLFTDNPNAVEWGIWWLRLFRTTGKKLVGIKGGTEQLVRKIEEELQRHDRVRIRRAQEVLAVEPAGDPAVVRLHVRDRRDGHEYVAEAEHCILALPLAPLRRLAGALPEEIQEDLNAAFGFPMLKCFLVVKDSSDADNLTVPRGGLMWWRKGMPTHAGVGGVATRELHFKSERRNDGHYGLVMLYTDRPASEFWKQYVRLPLHDHVELGPDNTILERALVRYLMVQARRQAHLSLRELLLDEFDRSSLPVAPEEGKRAVAVFCKALQEWIADSAGQAKLKECYQQLIGTPSAIVTMVHLERVLDVLRHPGFPGTPEPSWLPRRKAPDAALPPEEGEQEQQQGELARRAGKDDASAISTRRKEIRKKLRSVALEPVLIDWVRRHRVDEYRDDDVAKLVGHFVDRLVDVTWADPDDPNRERSIESKVDIAEKAVVEWGIRDWSRLPVGAGNHAWNVGARSWEVMARLEAFALPGRSAERQLRNMHICGEALSDYQGFIEGALRSATRVVRRMTEAQDHRLDPGGTLAIEPTASATPDSADPAAP